MDNKHVVKVDRRSYDFLSGVLGTSGFYAGYKGNHIFKTFSVDLGEGLEVDINVVNGEDPYINAVLYDHGVEMLTLDPTHELLGDYAFEHFGEQYVVSLELEMPVVKEKEKKKKVIKKQKG